MEDTQTDIADEARKFFSVEAMDGAWRICADRKLRLFVAGDTVPRDHITLEEGQLYLALYGKDNSRRGYIFPEAYTEDRCTFRKYQIAQDVVFTVGKAASNSIEIANPYISTVHAQIALRNNIWTIVDNNSTNGIYVNEVRIRGMVTLNPGDMIYIMGFKLVVGNHFIAMNNPNRSVLIHTNALAIWHAPELTAYEAPEESKEQIYYRSPRFKRDIVPLELSIDGPTAQERQDSTPLALSLAPSLVMGCASFASGIFTMANTVQNSGNIVSSIPTLVMSLSMLCGMIVFPFIMKVRDRKQKAENEQIRREKYLKYLSNIRGEIYKASSIQKEILCENFPPIAAMLSNYQFYEGTLWSRIFGQDDFLTIRVGTGNIPLFAELKFPDQRFSIDDDIMREEVNKFREEKKFLEGVPVTFSLMKHRVCGVIGECEAVERMMTNILLQIAALHSYDEVKVIFICEEKDLHKYEYVRWMQHCWSNENNLRFLATSPEEVRDLSACFSRVFQSRRGENATGFPHYVVISASKALSDRCAFIAELLGDATICGFSYLAVYDELKNLPKECSIVLQLHNAQGVMYNRRTASDDRVIFVQDKVNGQTANKSIMDIAEYRLDLQKGKYALPGMLTFLEMFGVGKIEHLNVATRWRESNPVTSLQTPIGVDSDGGVFYLDLHERAHGPHGLVAGMTGSGKSEFIITFILSLAVNYHPDEVAFVLIDYKGGGLTGAFENSLYRLPHLAGTITNLDGASITRSLLSIQSELRRRQTVFNEARRIFNEGTMDIYKYQKLYRSGAVKEAVPHLFIISDEFAELRSQQSEFMEQLISTARIGRSLGVHLILATQKPNGVVNDQIWANSKFKVCLKVQDRADSMDMLKRPDAAELVETGRFYLQVGYNELFEMGQSAWCGAPYVPVDKVERETDEKVQLIDHLGNVIEEAKPKRNVREKADAKKQIVEVMQYITQIAAEEHAAAKALWLPEIPAMITVDATKEKYHYRSESEYVLNPVIGEMDDPFNQSQNIMTLPLTEQGNAVCYGSMGSGKTTFLTAVLYSMYQEHTSATLNTYILDFGAETLRMFRHAPQTGDFVIAGEDEKLANLFSYLKREMERRKKLFTEYGGDYISYARTGQEVVPNIVVVVNNYSNLAEQYEELDEKITVLTRECPKYGIYFVITCPSVIGIRHKLQQNFNQTFALQLNDKTDYISLLGSTGGVYPSQELGRGIFRKMDVYMFQTAHVTENTENIAAFVRNFCREMENAGQKKAYAIPVMPRVLRRKQYKDYRVSYQDIPVGLESSTFETYRLDMRKYGAFQLLAMDRHDITFFLEGVTNLMLANSDMELYVFDPEHLLALEGIDRQHYIWENFEETVVQLFRKTVERHNTYKQSSGNPDPSFDMHPIVVVIHGLGILKSQLTEDGVDKLRLMMSKTHGKLNLSFLVADDYQSSNRYCAEDWCGSNGIWVGSGITDQVRLKFSGRSIAASAARDFTSGYVVEKNHISLVKLLVSDHVEVEEADE